VKQLIKIKIDNKGKAIPIAGRESFEIKSGEHEYELTKYQAQIAVGKASDKVIVTPIGPAESSDKSQAEQIQALQAELEEANKQLKAIKGKLTKAENANQKLTSELEAEKAKSADLVAKAKESK
jgi:chromosome segregation ATPase